MQLRLMLRGEGFRGKRVGNQTAAESHSNGCTAFLNFLPTSSLSIKQMIYGTVKVTQEACKDRGSGLSIWGGFTEPSQES